MPASGKPCRGSLASASILAWPLRVGDLASIGVVPRAAQARDRGVLHFGAPADEQLRAARDAESAVPLDRMAQKASGVATDLGREIVREIGFEERLVDTRCARSMTSGRPAASVVRLKDR